MKHIRRYHNRYAVTGDYTAIKVMIASAVFSWVVYNLDWSQWIVKAEFVSPLSDAVVVQIEKEVYLYGEDVDGWVGKYVDKYFKDHKKSEARMIMHCLLHRESGHGASNAYGDGGKAGGILQFHQETWIRMRKQMIKAGFITEIGDRLNKEQAIETTVWALKNGRGTEWGPIYREAKGSDFATCPMPSWSK